jgi:hypothetical protein
MAKQTAQDIIDQLAHRETPTCYDEDPEFDEVEQRLQTAQYYKLLLREALFGDDQSPAAAQVEAELREFVRTRVKVLLGMEGPKVNVIERDPVFNADEITALKELAHRLLAASEDLGKPQKAPSSPVEAPKAEVRPVEVQADKKRPGPKPGAKYGPRKPSLRQVSVPEDLRSQEAPSTPARAAPAAPPKAKPFTKAPAPGSETDSVEELPPNPNSGARRIRKNGKILQQAIDPNDGAILENEHGGEIWLDITPQVRPSTGFVPMPQASSQPGSPFEQLGMQDAMNTQSRVSNGPLSDTINEVLRG